MKLFGRIGVGLVALVYAQASPQPALAAWPPQGTLVGDGSGIQAWASLCSDGGGGALVSWVGTVGDTSVLFLQRFASDGTIQPGWPSAGRTITGLPFQPSDPMNPFVRGFDAAPDHSGGAFLTWLDFDQESNLEIRLIRVNGSGQIAAGWPAEGVLVMGSSPFSDPIMVEDGLGGVFVGWADLQDGDLHARVQRYTAGGQVAPGWPAGGARPNGGFNSQEKPAIRADGSGGVWIGWVHSGNIAPFKALSTIDYTRVVHHVTATGAIDSALPPGGVRVSGYDPWAELGLVADPAGGVFAVWRGSDLNSQSGLIAQRLAAGGAPAAGWPAAGVRYSPGGFDHWERSVVPDGQGGILSSWGTYEAGPNRLMTRGQRVRADGTIPPGWDTAGVPVGYLAEYMGGPCTVADGAGGVIVVWPDSAAGGGTVDLFARRVRVDGSTSPASGQQPLPLCTAPGMQGILKITSDGAGGAYVAWIDQRLDQGDVYLRRIVSTDFTLDVPQASPSTAALLKLSSPRPNPFRDHVTLEFALARAGWLTAEVVDVAGRRCRLLERAHREAGAHRLTWDGLDDQGRQSAPGLFWVVVRTENATEAARLLRLK